MKCPFRKSKIMTAQSDTGRGYPSNWVSTEKFGDCIGEECAAYYVVRICYPEPTKVDGCALCPKTRD